MGKYLLKLFMFSLLKTISAGSQISAGPELLPGYRCREINKRPGAYSGHYGIPISLFCHNFLESVISKCLNSVSSSFRYH